MNIEFKKDLRNNYMILSEPGKEIVSDYCIKMLEHQSIQGILPVDLRRMDHQQLFYYEITAKQSLESLLDRCTLTHDNTLLLCEGIIQALEAAYDHLLNEDDFILSSEYIFLDITSNLPSLCYYPGYNKNIQEQMRNLMEFLMNKIDYNDKNAVLMIYQLYAVTREEGFTLSILKNALYINADKDGRGITHLSDQVEPEELLTKLPETGVKKQSDQRGKGQNDGFDMSIEDQRKNRQESVDGNGISKDIPAMLERVEGEAEKAYYPINRYLLAGISIILGVVILMIMISSRLLNHSFGNRIDYSKLFACLLIIFGVEGYLFKKLFDKKNKLTKIIKTVEYLDPRKSISQYISLLGSREKQVTDTKYQEKLDHQIGNIGNPKKNIKQEKEGYSKEDYNKVDYNMEIYNNKNFNDKNHNKKSHDRKNQDKEYYEDYDKEVDGATSQRINMGKNIWREKREITPSKEDMNPTRLLNENINYPTVPRLKAVDEIQYKDIILTSYPFFIGKLKKNVDYCLEKDIVSRFHAKISKEGDQYYLTDLNSTNGTYINHEPLQTYQRKEIKSGDEIAFATIKYRFISE